MNFKLRLTHIHNYKQDAKKRNIEFLISLEYMQKILDDQNYKCALSGLNLSVSNNMSFSRKGTMSLDRIDSSKPYVEGNIQWLHKTVNIMKNKWAEEEFFIWCKLVAEHNK